jgi:Sigma-70, region 4
MKKLVTACALALEDAGKNAQERREALIVCLRDEHACTLDQIGKALGISGERVRQLYRRAKQSPARSARGQPARLEELSTTARATLQDAGLLGEATFGDVAVLIPVLRLGAEAANRRFNAFFHLPRVTPATLREIEEWLARHGVIVD